MQADEYFILSEWYYLAILNLLRTKNFKSTPEHIAERLGISKNLITQAIDRLTRTGLMKIEDGKYIRTKTALESSDGIPNLALRKSHYQTLDLARQALEHHPFESYDTTWLTFAFDPKDIEEARQKIRDFQDEFADQFSISKEATEVYRLAMQFFSLTKPQPEKKKTKNN
jgi:uncharacterized protein (TIGR02147 family)